MNTPLWSWGESKHRNLSEASAWTTSARGFKDACLAGMSVSVWWCAFCAMKCATLALSAAEDDSALEVARFQKFPPFFNDGLFFAVKDAIIEFRSFAFLFLKTL